MNEALHLFDRTPSPGKWAAAVMTVGMHVLLALFLVYGIRWQTSAPEAVEVELVRPGPTVAPRPNPEPVKEPTPEPEPIKEPPPKPIPTPKEPPPKAVTPPKPDIAVKEKEKPKPEPKFDPMQEMLRKETEQLRKQNAANAAAKELAQLESSKAASAKSKAMAGYADKIRSKIRGNLLVPPGVSGNPEAEFVVNQLPSGEVIEVKLRRSSGHKALDDAIERAIIKSSPLPKPDRPEDFVRSLDLKFRPLETPVN